MQSECCVEHCGLLYTAISQMVGVCCVLCNRSKVTAQLCSLGSHGFPFAQLFLPCSQLMLTFCILTLCAVFSALPTWQSLAHSISVVRVYIRSHKL